MKIFYGKAIKSICSKIHQYPPFVLDVVKKLAVHRVPKFAERIVYTVAIVLVKTLQIDRQRAGALPVGGDCGCRARGSG